MRLKEIIHDGSEMRQVFVRVSSKNLAKLESQLKPGQKLSAIVMEMLATCSLKEIESLVASKRR